MDSGQMNGLKDGWMDGHMEFLPVPQDFVPCQGRCPAPLRDFETPMKQGKGSADLMMPFGRSPDKGHSRAKWGENPYNTYICTSVHMYIPPGSGYLQTGPHAPLVGPQSPLVGPQALLIDPQTS